MDGWMEGHGRRPPLFGHDSREGGGGVRNKGREKTGRAWGLRQRQQKKKKKGQV